MPAEDFTMIRVRRSTLERLKREIAKKMAVAENGGHEVPGVNPEPINPRCAGLSVDALLNWLLDEPVRKRRAAREQRARNRAAREADRQLRQLQDLHGEDLHGEDLHGEDLHGEDLHGPAQS